MPTMGNETFVGEAEVSGGVTLAGFLRRRDGEDFFFMRLFPARSSGSMDQFYQLGSDLVQGQDKINIAGLDRSLRHAEILRRGPVLSDDLAALLLDDLHPE
jgi:hypothetical protein